MKRALPLTALLLVAALAWLWGAYIPGTVRFAERGPLTSSPADLDIAYEDFTLRPADAAITLHGWWMPADNARATLLFLHGGSSNRDSRWFKGLEFYRAVTDAGISVAAIDLRNHGVSDGDGVGLQFGRTESLDARALVDWARAREPGRPLFLMGISMGGATAIRAVHDGADVDGLVLMDSLLDVADAFVGGVWATSGFPRALAAPAATAAIAWHGFPGGDEEPLALLKQLELPVLALQAPEDPVTRAVYMREAAAANPAIDLWLAPSLPADEPALADKGRWGTHVAAFDLFPEQTLAQITGFIARVAAP